MTSYEMIRNYRRYPIRAIFLWSLAALAAVLLFIALDVAKNIYTQALWFQSVGYQAVYAKTIVTRLFRISAHRLMMGCCCLTTLSIWFFCHPLPCFMKMPALSIKRRKNIS